MSALAIATWYCGSVVVFMLMTAYPMMEVRPDEGVEYRVVWAFLWPVWIPLWFGAIILSGPFFLAFWLGKKLRVARGGS